MKSYLQRIDTQTNGGRYDVTPLFTDHEAFSELVTDLSAPFLGEIDLVAGVDALGFILGTAIAIKLKAGFLPIRKGGKLPVPTRSKTFVDYTGTAKSLALRKDTKLRGQQVLVVDEWIETGAQIDAALYLIANAGGTVAGIATINMDKNAMTDALRRQYLFRIATELHVTNA